MVSIVYSFRWGNLLATSIEEYHFPCVGSYPTLATWNKGMEFILVWCMHHPTMVSQIIGSWTSGWMSSSSVVCKSLCSNSGAWYGRIRSTLKTGCRPSNPGMSSWKAFSPICLRILYGPYHKGFIFLYGPVKRSFFICNQTWSPIWNEWEIRCLSCQDLPFALSHCNISCAFF